MSLDALITAGKVLGLPGVCVLVWYLLERQRGKREEKDNEQRIDAENRRTTALETGFRSLAELVADHRNADQEAHSKQDERMAAIETTLHLRIKTPARGVTTEIVRNRPGDNR